MPRVRSACLAAALCVALQGLAGCGVIARAVEVRTTGFISPGPTALRRAKAAWQYFQTERNPATGLVETSAGSGLATPSSIADQLAAASAAYRLGVIDAREFDEAVSPVLRFLAEAQLSGGAVPGRAYSTQSGLLGGSSAGDPGWSAVELGRLLTWLRILADRHKVYAPYVARIVGGWRVCETLDGEGRLLRATPSAEGLRKERDLGAGYGAYAVQGFRAWGEERASVSPPSRDFTVSVEGIDMPISETGSGEPLLTPPYALLAMEFDWRDPSGGALEAERTVASQLLLAQTRYADRRGGPVARGDYHRSAPPYEVVDGVVVAGYPWSTVGSDGSVHPELALLSTKAAVGLWAMNPSSYAERLMDDVGTLFDPQSGWYEGRYEASGAQERTRSSSTNAMVLEAIAFRYGGRLFPSGPSEIRASADAERNAGACAVPVLRVSAVP